MPLGIHAQAGMWFTSVGVTSVIIDAECRSACGCSASFVISFQFYNNIRIELGSRTAV